MREVLSREAIAVALADLPEWRSTGDRLVTAYVAVTVGDALALVAAIGTVAEELDHHPDVDWRYRHVFVGTTSHDVGGRISRRDMALAVRISALARTAPVTAVPARARVGA